MCESEKLVWYAMRAVYGKELETKRLLDKEHIKCFIPMTYKCSLKKGVKIREQVPAIANLIFVYATLATVREIKEKTKYLQYIINSRTKQKIIVPNSQMRCFVHISNIYNEKLIYLSPQEINLNKGTAVRIIGGSFNGVEGVYLKVKGSRAKRVVIVLNGICALVTAEIDPDFIERIIN